MCGDEHGRGGGGGCYVVLLPRVPRIATSYFFTWLEGVRDSLLPDHLCLHQV